MARDPDDPGTIDLFELTPIQRRLVEASDVIRSTPPARPDFMHGVLCQVGLPRRQTPGPTFERTSGSVSMRVSAGELWDGSKWVEQPLPYGTRPRLALVHVSSEAVRTQSREVDIGHSIREFLTMLNVDTGGRGYSMFKRQMNALAACEMKLGIGSSTLRMQPIEEFEAWLHPTGKQATLWPGTIRLSERFFETLAMHAVPLDHRALAALANSALGMDIYTWLAHRLPRIRKPDGIKLSWANLRDQFGQEYRAPKDFKREFEATMRSVLTVYPHAKVEREAGGIVLRPSLPPIPKTITTGWKAVEG